jgi:hypothetical protein
MTPPDSPLWAPGVDVDTPSAFYCTGEEFLRVSSFGSLASVELAVRTRFLGRDGALSPSGDRHVPTSTRTLATTDHPLGQGWLLGCAIFATVGTPRVGQVFVVVDLIRGSGAGAVIVQTLAQGYVTDTSRLSWPASPIRRSIDGPGVLRSITGTDPAANTEVSETVPTNARWRLRGFAVQLVTDANVATRRVVLQLDDGATLLWAATATDSQVASLTRQYGFPNVGSYVVAQVSTIGIPGPEGLPLQGGFRVRTATVNIQVTDNYGAPQLLVEEWIED